MAGINDDHKANYDPAGVALSVQREIQFDAFYENDRHRALVQELTDYDRVCNRRGGDYSDQIHDRATMSYFWDAVWRRLTYGPFYDGEVFVHDDNARALYHALLAITTCPRLEQEMLPPH